VTAALRPDGRLIVTPSERITPALDMHIRTHRDELTDELRSERAPGADVPTLEERDRALPSGLKASYCPGCGGRAVVVAAAIDHLRCAGCVPLTPTRRRPTIERAAP
jgi:hypothetical protein